MSATAVPMLRASSVRDCTRKAVYEATGAPARDRYPAEERTLFRGKSIGREYTIMLASTHGLTIWVDSGADYWVPPELRAASRSAAGLIAEKRVQWSHGIGHEDIFVRDTRSVVEVLSSSHASDAMVRSKMLQAVLYMEHDDEAESGALTVVSPTDLSEEVFPLAKTSRTYKELVEEMRGRVAQVQAWAGDGELPARVCSKPSESRGHFCVFAEHCFDGWEAPQVPLLEDDGTRLLVKDLYDAKQAEREARAILADKETTRKQLEQRLDDLVPVGKHRAGGLEVTRTHVQRKPSFQWEKAETAGVFDPDAYADFFKAGASYDTFRVERVSDEPAATVDFGDVPWTDADLDGKAA